MTTEVMAAIPAVWPAVAMCPVVQKQIAKISAVPISRHVTAFAIALRIGMLSPLFPLARVLGRPSRWCAARVLGLIVLDIEVPVVIVAEFQRGPLSCAALAGPLISGSTRRSTDDHGNR
jgi:hypothetical protein